tara:strand:+ start:146 stop:457 length:312 start_codon:yes stop_codon:yes gene_type:complete
MPQPDFYLDLKNFDAFGAEIEVFYKSEGSKSEPELIKSYYVSIRSVHDWNLVDDTNNVSILSSQDFFYHSGSVENAPETHFEIIAECLEVAERYALQEKSDLF